MDEASLNGQIHATSESVVSTKSMVSPRAAFMQYVIAHYLILDCRSGIRKAQDEAKGKEKRRPRDGEASDQSCGFIRRGIAFWRRIRLVLFREAGLVGGHSHWSSRISVRGHRHMIHIRRGLPRLSMRIFFSHAQPPGGLSRRPQTAWAVPCSFSGESTLEIMGDRRTLTTAFTRDRYAVTGRSRHWLRSPSRRYNEQHTCQRVHFT